MDIQRLRNLVLLGMEENNWLNQNVLNNNSLEFFKFIFPRTKEKALLNLAIQATCIEHDKNIQGNKYHLFSLPYNIEKSLDSKYILMNETNFIEALEKLAEGIAIDGKSGPILIGSTDELTSKEIFQIIAMHYLIAFKSGYKTYPYLS
jgi:hypothetical protein